MESQCDGDYVANMGWSGGHDDDGCKKYESNRS